MGSGKDLAKDLVKDLVNHSELAMGLDSAAESDQAFAQALVSQPELTGALAFDSGWLWERPLEAPALSSLACSCYSEMPVAQRQQVMVQPQQDS